MPILGFDHTAIDLVSVKLQQWIIQLVQYNFNLVHADALSRNSAGLANVYRTVEFTICFLLKDTPIDSGKATDAALQDAEWCKVIHAVQGCWPDSILKRTLSTFSKIHSELH